MARKATAGLTERESEIMEVLWELESATSEEIRTRLKGKPHDSSVRTLLRILIKKKFVKANAKTRPTQYRAAVRKGKAQQNAVSHLVQRLFGGSPETLVLRMLENKQLTIEQLEEIKKLAAENNKEKK